ncbi:hypothetical protein [Streptomyces sp. NRRL WC-3719]|uniref:hypothetical protein n=1 Tax=Streptomyces sp. NRRL WC-3719 TaxID=1463932 RepID=UPI0004CD9AA1|nr:hypothetical protein [Streptomyces sp. NRRL WC-3719]
MTLDNLIDALTAVDSTLIVPDGFTNPHSYRGYYDEVAFEPAHDVTAGAMLADALAARGATYTGWKGGEYTMTGDTPCWLAHEGSAGGEALDEDRVRRMLASARPADAAGGAEVTILDFAEPSGCTHCGVPKADNTGEDGIPYCADCGTEGCRQWMRTDTRLTKRRMELAGINPKRRSGAGWGGVESRPF